MNIQKINIDDLEILKKYILQTRNFYVSSEVDEFTCGAKALLFTESKRRSSEKVIGISKEDHRASNRCLVHGFLGCINGGS